MNESADSSAGAEGTRFGSFSEALDSARKDAGAKAREAAPKWKDALEGAAHDIVYGVAFGACFAGYFAKELVSEELKAAMRRGARAGTDAAENRSDPATASEAPAT